MQLAPEQLENAARIAYEMWHDGYQSWGECPERHKEDMRKVIAAAFAAVELPHVDVPRDLHSKAEMAAWEALGHGSGLVDPIQMMTIVGTALRVALDDPRVLGEPTFDEFHQAQKDKYAVASTNATEVAKCSDLLASRRARLLQPKTVEERVTIRRTSESQGPIKWHVCLDGETVEKWEKKETAEIYRLGLIAKLKAEGTVSGETSGDAQ